MTPLRTACARIDGWVVGYCHLALFALLLVPIFLVSKPAAGLVAAVLLLAFLWLIRGTRWTRVLVVPVVAVSILQFGDYLYSGRALDEFFWMALYSTDYGESLSFFSALSWPSVLALAFYVVACAAFTVCFFRGRNIRHPLEKAVGLLVVFTAVAQLIILRHTADYVSVQASVTGNYYSQVYKGIEGASSFNISTAPIALSKSGRGPIADQILVVIGESETRLRMGIYGYDRDTTPLVGKDAYVFKNNFAVGINTQPNVQALLTGLLGVPPHGINQDIFRVARMMGYKSVFIDNNAYQNNDPVVRLAMQADRYISMNGVGQTSTANDNKVRYDQVVLRPLEQQLSANASGKTLYMVHIIGSHPDQSDRFPKAFGRFPSYYDNSVLYTDYILKRIRDVFFAHVKGPAVVIYMSDHGVGLPPGCGFGKISDPENVDYGADDRYFSNYAIPLIVWTNAAFNAQHPQVVAQMVGNLAKPTDQLFLTYSVAELMGVEDINHRAVDSLSIFSRDSDFAPRENVYGADIAALIKTGKVCKQ